MSEEKKTEVNLQPDKANEQGIDPNAPLVKKTGKTEVLRVLKFALFSVSAGIIQLGAFTLLNEVLHLPYWVSYLIALVLSVAWNFTFNRKFTFRSANNVPIAMLKVAAFYVVFTPLSTLAVNWLTGLGWNEYVVTLLNMAVNLITEFLYDNFFVFRKSIDTNNVAKKAAEKELEKETQNELKEEVTKELAEEAEEK